MENTTCLVPLTQGQSAIVSPEDYEWTKQYVWFAHKAETKHGCLWYAWRTEPGIKRKTILLHREIAKRAGLPESKKYDHRDRNGLNNLRNNIRPATHNQNMANREKWPGTTSRYKGVSWHKCTQKWMAGIRVNGKNIYLGLFTDEIEAAAIYAAFAIFYHGEFSCF